MRSITKMIGRAEISDYDTFVAYIKRTEARRKRHGCIAWKIYRCVDNPQEVLLCLDWKNMEDAKRYIQMEEVRDDMEEVGVFASNIVITLHDWPEGGKKEVTIAPEHSHS